ncbi:MAG: beta-L-arabinofuranosidase domain-containing protein [Bryobacteraceae bacterium]
MDEEYFDPLAEGRNILPGKHGYSHAIALSSGAKAYEMLGNAKYLRAIRNAWDMLAETQEYASGAWAPKEAFVRPRQGELAASLASTHDHFETPCGYYAHSKLARYLLGFTADARYGDGLERVLLNTILGAIDPDDNGGYFYYSDYHAQARKGYYQRKWPCCAGTLAQSVADYPIDLYFQGRDGVYVNLFAESELRWKTSGVGVKLAQRTRYPEAETVELRVVPESPVEFAIHVRIPGWLERPAQIAVNGRPVPVETERGTFATIRRRWRPNDTVEVTLPFSPRTVPIDDRNPNLAAVMMGPLLMTAIDPPAELAATRPAIAGIQAAPGAPMEFDCRTAGGAVRMRPFYRVERETYSTYFKLPV